jgi:hypothetical protein
MTRLAALVLAAVTGYLVGQRRDELLASLRRLRPERGSATPVRSRPEGTEYDHEYEREAAHRHDVAEEIRRHPLRERPSGASVDEHERIASQPIRRERDDHPYPTSY